MKAIICDRCGRVAERGIHFHATVESDGHKYEKGCCDLCEDCFKDFLENLKEYPKIYSQPTDSNV